jgi:hypothetical protein
MTSTTVQDLFAMVWRQFFERFQQEAVVHTDLLCYISAALAGCPLDQIVRGNPTCGISPTSSPGLGSPGSDGNGGVSVPDATEDCSAVVALWMQRLLAWVEAPGIPMVELLVDQSSGGASAQSYKAHLRVSSEAPGAVCFCHAGAFRFYLSSPASHSCSGRNI